MLTSSALNSYNCTFYMTTFYTISSQEQKQEKKTEIHFLFKRIKIQACLKNKRRKKRV